MKSSKGFWLWWGVCVLFVALLIMQGVMGLVNPAHTFRMNYFYQPVSSGLQLVVSGVVLPILIYALVRRRQFFGDEKPTAKCKDTFISGKVPNRFPWE